MITTSDGETKEIVRTVTLDSSQDPISQLETIVGEIKREFNSIIYQKTLDEQQYLYNLAKKKKV